MHLLLNPSSLAAELSLGRADLKHTGVCQPAVVRSVFIFFIVFVFIGHLSLENNPSLLGPALSQPGQAQQQVLGWLLLRSLGDDLLRTPSASPAAAAEIDRLHGASTNASRRAGQYRNREPKFSFIQIIFIPALERAGGAESIIVNQITGLRRVLQSEPPGLVRDGRRRLIWQVLLNWKICESWLLRRLNDGEQLSRSFDWLLSPRKHLELGIRSVLQCSSSLISRLGIITLIQVPDHLEQSLLHFLVEEICPLSNMPIRSVPLFPQLGGFPLSVVLLPQILKIPLSGLAQLMPGLNRLHRQPVVLPASVVEYLAHPILSLTHLLQLLFDSPLFFPQALIFRQMLVRNGLLLPLPDDLLNMFLLFRLPQQLLFLIQQLVVGRLQLVPLLLQPLDLLQQLRDSAPILLLKRFLGLNRD